MLILATPTFTCSKKAIFLVKEKMACGLSEYKLTLHFWWRVFYLLYLVFQISPGTIARSLRPMLAIFISPLFFLFKMANLKLYLSPHSFLTSSTLPQTYKILMEYFYFYSTGFFTQCINPTKFPRLNLQKFDKI